MPRDGLEWRLVPNWYIRRHKCSYSVPEAEKRRRKDGFRFLQNFWRKTLRIEFRSRFCRRAQTYWRGRGRPAVDQNPSADNGRVA